MMKNCTSRLRSAALSVCVLTAFLPVPPVHAQPAIPVLSEACETQLALSAIPARLRADATVYVHTPEGFVISQSGAGALNCIVERNHPLTIIPQCLDQAGADAILPALKFKTERIMAGLSPEQVSQAHAEMLEAEEFSAPGRAGVSYMISAYNLIYLSARDERVMVGPHVMFYAPGLHNEDIGGSQKDGTENRGMPFVLDNGPHGYMIAYVDHASELDGVISACEGELAAFGLDGP